MVKEAAVPRRSRRVVLITASVLVAGALFAGGWAAALVFRSPAQIDAAAQPPDPSLITATVVRGQLADVINAQGTVANVDEISTAVPTPDGGGSVTLSPVTPGQQASAGTLLLEVNNQPLFAMPGSFPFFRDMKTGDTGRDVLQLQNGLIAAGYALTADGAFGRATAEAVAGLFRANGYAVPLVDPAADATDGDAAPVAPATPAPPSTKVVSAPAAAFLVVPQLPAAVLAIPATGALPEKAAVVTSSGETVVKATVVPAVAAQLEEGMSATMLAGSTTVALTLLRIVEVENEDGESSFDVLFAYTDASQRPQQAGAEGLVSITREIVAEESLLVPSRAVLSRGESRYVLVAREGGFVEVAVSERGALDGTSAVTAVDDGELDAGDEVRVQ
ncbi:peptidoglycan-binding protein [Microbacterium sp. NPDC060132]|uniref:peptidoglycan-binding domain-containing protein n=1 Tax=unclassified Microbacterium TaxID=2609290 RepID=UPI00365D3BBC